jgi:hypothetical protein
LARYLTRPRGRPAPSPEELAEKECIDAAVAEAIAIMTPWVKANPARTLKSLNRKEVESLVWGAISKWIVARSEAEAAMPNDAIDDLWR